MSNLGLNLTPVDTPDIANDILTMRIWNVLMMVFNFHTAQVIWNL